MGNESGWGEVDDLSKSLRKEEKEQEEEEANGEVRHGGRIAKVGGREDRRWTCVCW